MVFWQPRDRSATRQDRCCPRSFQDSGYWNTPQALVNAMSSRILIGLSVGSGLEGVDVAVVRGEGVGLGLSPTTTRTARAIFPPSVRDVLRPGTGTVSGTASAELIRNIADTASHAIRTVIVQGGVSVRDVFSVGLLEPARGSDLYLPWHEIVDHIAEQTGLSIFHGFRGRDRAAGGTGRPITAVAEYLLFRHPREDRLLIHLGAATDVLLIPAGAKISATLGFEAGPGNQLLDALIYHGTRGREATDPGGKKAVQGCCLEPLLARWLEHPHLTRKPPKAVHPDAFGRSFLLAAFDTTRQLGAGLPDLLCTATHLIARAVGEGCRTWLPAAQDFRAIFLTGGGVRNGFLWQLMCQQFEGVTSERSDIVGVPALARNAIAAAILAALTCDGVAGNLPVLTGAAGGRLLGQVVPGDGRNWARCAAWIADQTGDYPRVNRAA